MSPLKVKSSKVTGKTSTSPKAKVKSKEALNNVDMVSRIAVSAYYKAEARGYEPGHEIQDWLEAEAEMQP